MRFRSLQEYKEAIDDGMSDPQLIIDEDVVIAVKEYTGDDFETIYRTDPLTLLEEALDLLGLEYEVVRD